MHIKHMKHTTRHRAVICATGIYAACVVARAKARSRELPNAPCYSELCFARVSG